MKGWKSPTRTFLALGTGRQFMIVVALIGVVAGSTWGCPTIDQPARGPVGALGVAILLTIFVGYPGAIVIESVNWLWKRARKR